jgi:predicted O-linked N-acetylglucosamine transferase (SPINDLY family)
MDGERSDGGRVLSSILASQRGEKRMSTSDVGMTFHEALGLHRQGRLQEASAAYEIVLGVQPTHSGAAHLLGLLRLQSGDVYAAMQLLRQAIRFDPLRAELHSDLGSTLRTMCLLDEALISVDRAIELNPALVPAHHNRGGIQLDRGEPTEALASYDRAVGLNPALAPAYYGRARTLMRLGRPQEALEAYDRAVQLIPGFVEAINDRGIALLELGRAEEALVSFDAVLARQPGASQALNNRGNALRSLKRFAEALACFDRALERAPTFFEALRNRAIVLRELGRAQEALEAQVTALTLRPEDVDTLRDRVETLLELKRHEEALETLERLATQNPGADYVAGLRLHLKHALCDWTSYSERVAELVAEVRDGRRADYPFPFLAVTDEAAAQRQCAGTFASHKFPPSPRPLAGASRYRHQRIRLAYLSADLRFHVVSSLLAGVFERHDRTRFELTAISFRPMEESSMGQRVHTAFDSFIDVSRRTDREVAQLVRDLEIDIAVDLMGYTHGARTGVFAHRPAPVQVSYLGYPGTSGAPYIDYLIADDFVVPERSRDHYAEKIVYLPDCFQASDDRRFLRAQVPSRQSLGLPESGFVWCCFNNDLKMNPHCFDIWMQLLHEIPDSTLWLLAESPAVERNLRAEAAARGVNAERLRFSPRVPYDEYLARLQCADLFLDTLPFNGGSTASDALWAGLPVLTCAGEAYASRMAGSLLRAIGLPELVTERPADYAVRALELARNPPLLQSVTERLVRNRAACPLFDTGSFCRHLEAAYVRMWERNEAGLPPETFTVPKL